ncbi:hypothetical protein ADK67_12295 [Saccharothrix sp. NRRL B-16348]|jgi:hypothetical protein|uniref:hypothetical protein n=1 Tax=Saccharothrix sp. NRRL B-16348 TaxID=1415542 RepID=UPI0006AFF1B6|nr:hypothetical protein [Saccharothrix sp. NRRL B-16348]KOX28199.1 hypothetical protein ADK67_12295 [Saccharothrix sp. NRRL B-16348]
MNTKVASVLLALGLSASLVGCSSNEDKFVEELKAAGFTAVGEPRSESEKKTKKVGKRTVKSSQKTLEVTVRVKGCDLEFAKVSGQSGYWLDELHVNGQEPDWPGYPENLKQQDVVAAFAGNQPKPDGFKDCYQPNQP